MLSVRAVIAITVAMLAAACAVADDKPTVSVQLAKLPDLDKAIQAHKGKVVVVDIWSTT
jgi:hypothetical protein